VAAAGGATLIVDTSFLGDVLCAEPLVRAVARRWPEAPVDFLTSPGGAEVLRGHPDLREILVFDKRGADRGPCGLLRTARRLGRRGYARALCSHRSWRTAALLRLAGIPERTGFHDASGAWLYSRRVRYRPELHEIERNLELVGGGAWEPPRLYPGPAEEARARELLPEPGAVALAPGSLWTTKRWPREHFATVLRSLVRAGRSCVLLGGREDVDLCAEVLLESGLAPEEEGQVRLLAGCTSLRESFAVLRRCAALLTNDSAPMHLGVAAGIPVVALYCSTLPAFGFAPRGPRDRVLEVEGLACRPCGIHGRRSCPEGHFRCGRDLLPARAVEALLAAAAASTAG